MLKDVLRIYISFCKCVCASVSLPLNIVSFTNKLISVYVIQSMVDYNVDRICTHKIRVFRCDRAMLMVMVIVAYVRVHVHVQRTLYTTFIFRLTRFCRVATRDDKRENHFLAIYTHTHTHTVCPIRLVHCNIYRLECVSNANSMQIFIILPAGMAYALHHSVGCHPTPRIPLTPR